MSLEKWIGAVFLAVGIFCLGPQSHTLAIMGTIWFCTGVILAELRKHPSPLNTQAEDA